MNERVEEEIVGEENLRRRIRELEEENKKLRRLSTLDETTGLFLTQKIGREVILQQIEKIHYEGGTIGLVRMDIDDLKGWNRKLGHEVTDQLLVKVGEEIRNWALMNNGIGMRFHGDELGILVSCQDEKELEALMKNFMSISIEDLTDEELKVSWTVGCAHENEPEVRRVISELDYEDSKSLEDAGRVFTALCKIADERERKQKKKGKHG